MIKNSNLTDFENDIMNKLLDGYDPILEKLRNQYVQVKNFKREYTGFGFYLNFNLHEETEKINLLDSFQIDDVFAEMTNLKGGIGFILFINNGKLDFLEGFTYGEEKWPEMILGYELFYISKNKKDRDIEKVLSIIKGDANAG